MKPASGGTHTGKESSPLPGRMRQDAKTAEEVTYVGRAT